MKIYTKTGDGGTTSLVGGRRVAKSHPRVEAYGTVDELMAHTGHLRDSLDTERHAGVRAELLAILGRLMTAASILAAEGETAKRLPRIAPEDIARLETRIDALSEALPPLAAFTLPGGHALVSLTHIARTVCRRAERRADAVEDDSEQAQAVRRYLNRLSDYFYVLGRKLAADLHAEELVWNPAK